MTCGKPCHADVMAAVGARAPRARGHPEHTAFTLPPAPPNPEPVPPWGDAQSPPALLPGGPRLCSGRGGEAGAWRALTWRCWRWRRSWPRWTPRRTWCISAAGCRRGGAWSYAPTTPPAPRGQDRATGDAGEGSKAVGEQDGGDGGGGISDRWADRQMDGWTDTGKKQMGEGEEKERESRVSRGRQQLLMSRVAKRQRDGAGRAQPPPLAAGRGVRSVRLPLPRGKVWG